MNASHLLSQADRIEATPEPAPKRHSSRTLRKLRRQLKLLLDYQKDTLSHRAADVELAVEAVMLEQFNQQQRLRDSGLDADSGQDKVQSALENIGVAIGKLAEQQQIQRTEFAAFVLEHKQLDQTNPNSFNGRIQQDFAQIEPNPSGIASLQSHSPIGIFDNGDSPLNAVTEHQNLIAVLQRQLAEERQCVDALRIELDELRSITKINEIRSQPTSLSWHEQKALLLQQLEVDSETGTIEPGKALEIQNILERTEREVASRDREIAELKRLLSEQATASQDIAIGAAAVAEILNQDELLNEERENLMQLQEQWRLKLREAEIEISMERAKIARQRQELDEYLKLRQKSLFTFDDAPKAAPGSRWLSELGLSESPKPNSH